MMELKPRCTWLLPATVAAQTRYVVHEGGTRSSKTISLAEYILNYCLTNTGESISIARKSFPALRISAMRDFFDVLHNPGGKYGDYPPLYDESKHSKGLNTYELNGNVVEFMSVDDAQKKRGSSRDVLWINEANELTEDDARQLILRTRKKIILDYNPSGGERHWIRRNILTLPPEELTVIRSTYLDNPFLPVEQVREIERLKDQDPVAWSVFGLGKWAQLRGMIYTNWQTVNQMPEGACVYGLDFGFTNPLALVKVQLRDEGLYWEELIYESNLTTPELIRRMKDLNVKGPVYCDSAEPDRIQELRRARIDARPAKKDVMDGIDFCRRHKIHVANSPNIEEEISSYKMREAKDPVTGDMVTLEEPVKWHDHAMDAARYATFSHYFIPTGKPTYKSVSRLTSEERGAW